MIELRRGRLTEPKLEQPQPLEPEETLRSTTATTGTQTILTEDNKDLEELKKKCSQLEQDNVRLRAEKEELRVKTTELNEDFFKDDNEKVRFYTGLTNWNLLSNLSTFPKYIQSECISAG